MCYQLFTICETIRFLSSLTLKLQIENIGVHVHMPMPEIPVISQRLCKMVFDKSLRKLVCTLVHPKFNSILHFSD